MRQELFANVMNINEEQLLQSSVESFKYGRESDKCLKSSYYPANESNKVNKIYIHEGPYQFQTNKYSSNRF